MLLTNSTPWPAERLVTMDRHGREVLQVVVKQSFDVGEGSVRPAAQPDPLVLADQYTGEPGKSGLRYASDLGPPKPATDVILCGHALPRRRGDTQVDVALRLGAINKVVSVSGERLWARGLLGQAPTAPQPFERIPLVWERAFGGSDESNPERPGRCDANPVGRGFRARGSKLPTEGQLLPNLESPAEPIRKPSDAPAPRCFGFVAPHWAPRAGFAGTYDARWQEARMPLLPDDFDERFFQVAPADQILPGHPRGGEAVEVIGVSAAGPLRFQLPQAAPAVVVRLGLTRLTPDTQCDTVVIDADRQRLILVWRALVPVHCRVDQIEWIKIAPARSAAHV